MNEKLISHITGTTIKDGLFCVNEFKNIWHIYFLSNKVDDYYNAYLYKFKLKRKPELNEIKDVIINYLNYLCEEEIKSGLYYKDNLVWLSKDNQINYKNMFDLTNSTNGKNLPFKIKLGEINNPVYIEFNKKSEVIDFYLLVNKYINDTLNKYWILKDNIDWNNYV